MLQNDTAGDPQRSLKWKRKSLSQLSKALAPAHQASAPVIARLLRAQDYALHVNHKALAHSSPDRDDQFEYLQEQKEAFLQAGLPVISVDTKKRELIGLFKNAGATWCREPQRVQVHDFLSLAEGIAIPYGIYDLARNEGFVYVGTSADTAEFAVDAIEWWWRSYGCYHYPTTTQLLILADGGGSNGYRPRLWKYTLQQRLVNRSGLAVTVCHYPTGASKWNPIEHRLFSPISCNWAGQPLRSYDHVLNFVRSTTTDQGLVVQAALTEQTYPKNIKISAEQMDALNLYKHQVLARWNYTIQPSLN